MPKKPSGMEDNAIYASIAALRESSAVARERVIKRYMRSTARPARPPYLDASGILATHLERSSEELAGRVEIPGQRDARRAYVRAGSAPYCFSGTSAALSELCVGVMGGVLKARARLQVAAGFFSTMVACVDDYLDKEGSYHELGARLLYISHGYRDLMDMALDEQVRDGRLSKGELYEIKARLAGVMETLAASESAASADSYLYEKSCGDKVVGVLFPASGACAQEKEACAEIGRLVGEAGQLIDDILDYESDIEAGGRNYISEAGTGIDGAVKGAAQRVFEARGIAKGLAENGPLLLVLDAMDEAASLIGGRLGSKGPIGPGLLARSTFLNLLAPHARPSDIFLVWF